MPRKKEHKFEPKDQIWYDDRIPNPIVKDKAIQLHKNLGWADLRKPMDKNRWRVFGRSTVRNEGEKNDLSYLLAIELTGATSLVAVCDKVNGFSKKKSDNIEGKKCEIYINGKKITDVDTIATENIAINKETKSIGGYTEKEEVIDPGIKRLGRWTGRKTLPIKEGRIILNADINKNKPLSKFGENPVEIGPENFKLRGEFIIPIKEKADKDGEVSPFQCRIRQPRIEKKQNIIRVKPEDPEYPYTEERVVQETTGFNCVNWAKILDKSEASVYTLLI